MPKHYGLIAIIIILLGVNIVLFVTLQQRNAKLTVTLDKLTNSLTSNYLEGDSRAQSRSLTQFDFKSELYPASKRLSTIIDSLRDFSKLEELTGCLACEYFGTRISIATGIQAELLAAAEQFDRVIQQQLNTNIPAAKDHLRSLRQAAQKKFNQWELQAKSRPNGRHEALFDFHFFPPDTTIWLNLEWTKRDDTVIWHYEKWKIDEIEVHHLNYLTLLDRKINSPRAFRTSTLLNKLRRSIEQRGKLTVHNDDYDLNHITRGELLSACQYLRMLQYEIEESFIATRQAASIADRDI